MELLTYFLIPIKYRGYIPTNEGWKKCAFDIHSLISCHVETVCLLSKLYVDHHIEVDLNMDELDLTSAESKATYNEIKDYVLKTFDLKVTNLYIAQVKDKMGIKERENFNVSKKEDAKVPQCPMNKEEVIIDALKHHAYS